MFTTTVPGRRYTALRQQVLRLNGDYAAVRLPGDVLHAVLSVPLKDTQPVGPASAVEFYASALLAVDVTSRRPFLFSERWKVPPRPKGDNERLGSVPGREFPELLSRLRDAGLMPQDQGERSVDGEEPQRVARWSAPVEMTDGAHIDVVSRAILDLGGHVRGRNGHCNGKPFEMHAQGDTDESGAWDVAHPDETGF